MRIKSFLFSNLETRGDLDGTLSCGLFFKLFIKQYPWFLINANPYKGVKSPYYKYQPRLLLHNTLPVVWNPCFNGHRL
jgi:hypothetical protein